jgi:MerR family transcriptional regulator, light-induced transcriptional regulator
VAPAGSRLDDTTGKRCDHHDVSSEGSARWTAAAVAARLGVATTTLRTWSRRYGIGPADHEPGRHRRYTAADVAQLEALCALIADGVTPASAARLVRGGAEHMPPDSGAEEIRPRQPEADDRDEVRGLLSSVMRLDADTVTRAVERRIAAAGVVEAWEVLCVPALVEVGRRNATGACIDAEHLFSFAITAALHRVTGPGRPPSGRGALLSCAAGERHTLALEALRAALAERAAPVRALGADLPTAALSAAIRRTRPAVVALWAQTERTARTGALAHLQALGVATVLAIGPGWARRRKPGGILTADTLHDAVRMTLARERG